MAQRSGQASGRPAAAMLILVAIFATAFVLRVWLGPARLTTQASIGLTARELAAWSELRVATMDPPALERAEASAPRRQALLPHLELAPVTLVAVVNDVAMRPPQSLQLDGFSAQPPLAELSATLPHHVIGFAAPVLPASMSEPPSRHFDPVTTAFIKTGTALSFAFKKTGQGILAPF